MAFQCGGAAGDAEGEDDAACPAGTRALREDALGLRVGQENALCVRVDLLSDARGTVRADGLFHHARKIAVAAGVEYICTSDLASEDLFCCRVEIAMLWRRLALPCPGGARGAAWVRGDAACLRQGRFGRARARFWGFGMAAAGEILPRASWAIAGRAGNGGRGVLTFGHTRRATVPAGLRRALPAPA